ncbi:adenylyltransferase/cytidyltransferase family protein [Arthrobacter sp. GCM10027362]|uniref:adenylyltransferase/cytidyltransferase family protein n=1 Tax=Arthrobacter sp. GCM10027362 TaxID=3273379 RepID=UPI00363EB67B
MTVRIGYAGGVFDLFHIGHLNILQQARSHCDYLVAGVLSDERCEADKGIRPVIPLSERLEIVGNVKCVDEALPEVFADKLDTWAQVGFNVYFKGDDWRGTAKGRDLERRFGEVGVEVVYFPYTMHTSSTVLRQALAVITGPAGRDATGAAAHGGR